MKNTNMNRRTFLKVSAVAGSGLLVGCTFSSPKLLRTPQARAADLGVALLNDLCARTTRERASAGFATLTAAVEEHFTFHSTPASSWELSCFRSALAWARYSGFSIFPDR